MTKSRKILILGLVAIIVTLGVFPYDTDDSYRAVMKKYGYDIGERVRTPSCKDDGVGVRWVPFGTISSYCDTSWFVLFNMFPFQVVVGPREDAVQNISNHIPNQRVDKQVSEMRILQEMTAVELALLGIDIKDIPNGWYAHRLYEDTNTIFLTKEREQKLWLGKGLGAVGGYMLVYTLPIAQQPEEWIMKRVDFNDAFVLDYGWDFLNGRRHLRVEHQTPGADARTDYFLGYDRVAIATLYPLESGSETKTAYTRFLYNVVAPLVDIAYSRDVLRENCTQDIPREKIDDISFDLENKIVQTYWWDNEIDDNVSIILPYEPETDFAGCSESVKELLRHVQGIQEENIKEKQ